MGRERTNYNISRPWKSIQYGREISKGGISRPTEKRHIHPKGDYAQWAKRGLAKLDSERARLKGLKAYFAHASVGWDDNPRYPEKRPYVTGSSPEKFEKVLRSAKDWCDRNTPPGYPKLISINAWNEWIEGSYLEPDEKYGMGYLEAIRRVFVR